MHALSAQLPQPVHATLPRGSLSSSQASLYANGVVFSLSMLFACISISVLKNLPREHLVLATTNACYDSVPLCIMHYFRVSCEALMTVGLAVKRS